MTQQPQLPAYLANRPRRNLAEAAIAGLSGNSPPQISIANNRFKLVDAAGNERPVETFHLDVVVINVNLNVSKIYYAQDFDPSAISYGPPDCFSDNGVAPSSQASSPQCATCAACPNNVWGSDVSKVSGKQTRACKDVKKVAVVVPGDPYKLVYLLRVPPASLKLFKNYVQMAAGSGVDVSQVVTRLTFDAKTQGVLNFNGVAYIDEGTANFIDEVWDSPQTLTVIGANDVPRSQALPAPQQVAPAAVAPAPQSVPPPPQQLAQPVPPVQAAAPFLQRSQSVAEQPTAAPKRKRRTKAEIEAAQAANSPASAPPVAPFMQAAPAAPENFRAGGSITPTEDPLEVPNFLRRETTAPVQAAPAPASPQGFGIVQPAAPDAALQAEINKAFSLPT